MLARLSQAAKTHVHPAQVAAASPDIPVTLQWCMQELQSLPRLRQTHSWQHKAALLQHRQLARAG